MFLFMRELQNNIENFHRFRNCMHSRAGCSPQFAQYPDQLRLHNLALKKESIWGIANSPVSFLLNVLFAFIQTFCLVIAHLIFSTLHRVPAL